MNQQDNLQTLQALTHHLSVMISDQGTGAALTRYMEDLALAWAWAWPNMFLGPIQYLADAFFCAPLQEDFAKVQHKGCMWTT